LKYDRELMASTINAIKKIEDIKHKRQAAFIKKRFEILRSLLILRRLDVKKKVDNREQVNDLEKNIMLIKAPSSVILNDIPQIKVGMKKQKEAKKAEKMET
jgi:hypothetical protein